LTNKTIEAANLTGATQFAGSSGSAGQVLTSAGTGAAPTWSSPAAGGTAEFVATGTIANGATVGLRSDGTVEVVSSTITNAVSYTTSTQVNSTASVPYGAAVYDAANNRVVFCLRRVSDGFGIAYVGTISGTSITFGTAVAFTSVSVNAETVKATYDSVQQRVVVAYTLSSNSYLTCVVGQVSGTSITFGTPVTCVSYATYQPAICYDSTNAKVFLAYTDSSNRLYGLVGTVTGSTNTISPGTPTLGQSSFCFYPWATFHPPSGNCVISFGYAPSGGAKPSAITATISGTSVSFGSLTFLQNLAGLNNSYPASVFCAYHSISAKIVFAWQRSTGAGCVVTADVSGTNFNIGTISEAILGGISIHAPYLVVNNLSGNVNLFFWQTGYSTKASVITLSGSTVSVGAASTISTGSLYDPNAVWSSSDNVTVVMTRNSANNYPFAQTFSDSTLNTNAANYIGVAAQAISSGASGNVTIAGGVNSGVSGLTVNSKYYVQANGTLGTTNAGYPLVGRAISANKILVTNSLN
jgi:hypothetical protein